MQRLRSLKLFARLVLAWFVLSIGVAVASPLLKPQTTELICSMGGALKVVVKGDDGTPGARTGSLDCPLCAPSGAPPSFAASSAPPCGVPSHDFPPLPAAHLRTFSAAPLDARGPPSLS